MIVFPNAKINLGLSVVKKRDDGFHNIETVFYPIPLCDCLEIVDSDNFDFVNIGLVVDAPLDNNLCVKAYNLLKNDFDIKPVKMVLLKKIPFGAGLGGGSSNASFTLKLLNDFFGLKISDNVLQDYARKLGSDCAFFVKNTPVFASGKGDEFENISLSLKGKFLLLVKPYIFISTPKAYSGVVPKEAAFNLSHIANLHISEWKNTISNDFERHLFVEFPLLNNIKNNLYKIGAEYASMSGSGSSMFGVFNEKPIFDKKLFEGMFVAEMIL